MRKRMFSIFLTFVMLLSLIPSNIVYAFEKDAQMMYDENQLENVTDINNFVLTDTSGGYKTESICDGNFDTLWAANKWPNTLIYKMGNEERPLRRIQLNFEKKYSTRFADLTLAVKYEGEDNTVVLDEVSQIAFSQEYTYDFADGKKVSEVYVTMSNGTETGNDHPLFTPVYSEVEVFVDKEEGQEKLVNIAKTEDFELPSTSAGYSDSSICDGNYGTLWATPSWNTEPTFTYNVNSDKPIRKLVLAFEKAYSDDRLADIKLEVLYRGAAQKTLLDTKTEFSYADRYEYTFEGIQDIEQIYVTLSNPKLISGGQVLFTPAFSEVEVYVDENYEGPNLSKYSNIASFASVTPFEGARPETSSANLVDGDYRTLYTFHQGTMSDIQSDEVSIVMDLEENYEVNALEVAFEKKNADDTFYYNYSIYTQVEGSDEWKAVLENEDASRRPGENIDLISLTGDDSSTALRKVKFVLNDMTSTGWPSIAELKIFGINKEESNEGNIALNKPAHTNTNQTTSSLITDGKTNSKWTGVYFPGYVDIDLEENYYLNEIKVYMPKTVTTYYDIYTSLDGENFSKAYSVNSENYETEDNVIELDALQARIVRVYARYQSGGNTVSINEVKIYGEKAGTEVVQAKDVQVEDFEDSEYNVAITEDMVISEVQGIIERRLGSQYVDWFAFDVAKNPQGTDYDYYEISENNGKIMIKGNDGVSLATGLNYYLKQYLNVHISQVGDQVKMPLEPVGLNGKTIYKETKLPVRYAYNYCTHSYSMAFWGEEEWQNELDWLALNGVNVVLDITGQEEVWRRFLMELGYTQDEAKDFISGPAYYAWAYMSNMSNYGGPVHNSWFEERVDLARKNQLKMRTLGMQPILQGYSGMVPEDIESHDANAKGKIIKQGQWNGFQRPAMLKTTESIYNEYAQKFYQIQKEVYGDVTDYYATDPFHEGGITGGMDPSDISRIVLDEMIKFDSDAVWVIQSWQANPTPALLEGIGDRKEHALILDLWAEKDPRWDGESHYGYQFPEEFGDTPWVWCLLNNFGGRPGLKGYMDVLVNDFPTAYNNTEYMTGIGITPEASYNNPVLYDLFFELIWVDDADAEMQKIDIDEWLEGYITRRYGGISDNAIEAWDILYDTVYNSQINNNGEGPACPVFNARPGLDIGSVSCCDSTTIKYDKKELEKAAELLLKDYDKFKDSEGYQYDVTTVLLQVLANTAQEYQQEMSGAFRNDDLEGFEKASETFLAIMDEVDTLASSQETMMVGTWINQAKELAENADEFSRELYEFNARSLISTWGSRYQANSLHDYSNRMWSGLTSDLYKHRWQLWIDERIKELKGEEYKDYDWFEVEWEWANQTNEYTSVPADIDLKGIGEEVLSKYTVSAIEQGSQYDDIKDLDTNIKVTASSEQYTSGTEGPASNVLDGKTDTIWHSAYVNTDRSTLWIEFEFEEPTLIDGLRYLPRQNGSNGNITEYLIEYTVDEGDSYVEAARGKWQSNSRWKLASFEPVKVKKVRLTAVQSVSAGDNVFASAAEIRLTSPTAAIDKLSNMQAELSELDPAIYTEASYQKVKDAMSVIDTVLEKLESNTNVEATEVRNALNMGNEAQAALELKPADYTKVDELIAQADRLNSGDYTEVSWKQLQDAINMVVRDLDITRQSEVDAMAQAITDALSMLERLGDKTVLQQTYDEFLTIDLSQYTEETVAVFMDAMEQAEKVLKDDQAPQWKVDQVLDNLLLAKASLVKAEVDKDELHSMIEQAEKIDLSIYNADSAKRLENALKEAQEVYNDPKATKEQVEDSLLALSQAISGLVRLPVMLYGDGQIWSTNAESGLYFASDADYDTFIKVLVDGKEIDASFYTVSKGSMDERTVVLLSKEFLSKLAVGKHTISIVSESGAAKAQFNVKEAELNGSGDETDTGTAGMNTVGTAAIAILAGAAAVAFMRKKKESQKEK